MPDEAACLAGLERGMAGTVHFVPNGHRTGGVTAGRGGGAEADSNSWSTRTAATAMFSEGVETCLPSVASRAASRWKVPCGGVAAAGVTIGRLAAAIRSASGRRPVAAEDGVDCATIE